MDKKREEVGHNYPFDVDQSPYSRFEERVFPKLLVIVSVSSVIIVFLILRFIYGWQAAMFYSLFLIIFWVFLLGPILVKVMIKRREKKLGYK
jgi:predicted MFS family arabinose efflux permease